MHFVLRSPLFPLFHHSLFANVFLARMPVSLFVCVFVSVPCVYLCLVWMCVCPIVLRKEFVKQLSNLFDVSFNKLTHTRTRTHMHARTYTCKQWEWEKRGSVSVAPIICVCTHTHAHVCVCYVLNIDDELLTYARPFLAQLTQQQQKESSWKEQKKARKQEKLWHVTFSSIYPIRDQA